MSSNQPQSADFCRQEGVNDEHNGLGASIEVQFLKNIDIHKSKIKM